jgi:hypothetical protein
VVLLLIVAAVVLLLIVAAVVLVLVELRPPLMMGGPVTALRRIGSTGWQPIDAARGELNKTGDANADASGCAGVPNSLARLTDLTPPIAPSVLHPCNCCCCCWWWFCCCCCWWWWWFCW